MDQLYYATKPIQTEDSSHHERLQYLSQADSSTQVVDVYTPAIRSVEPLPLVIAPHPMGWTAEQDYGGGLPDLKRGYHRGYRDLAEKYHVIIAMPQGHHRKVNNSSLAYPYHIADLAYLPTLLIASGMQIDAHRVYACGLSMGGQEVLILAGMHPEILAAVVAFNPIVDLARWHDDLSISTIAEIKSYGTVDCIEDEIGGTPSQVPELYAMRSAITYARNIARTPTLLFWSERDAVIPEQFLHHSYRLYKQVKEICVSSPIMEYNHTSIHGINSWSAETCWMLHEWCDYEWAIQWLLQHSR